MPKANRGVEVLGTLALVAPSLADFQHVKVRVEGKVARLTLDHSDHNLLNACSPSLREESTRSASAARSS
jgi:hypothetical protein